MGPLGPEGQMPPEARTFLEGILSEAGQSREVWCYEGMLDELYSRLDVAMFAAILEHLPGKHLEFFLI
jgi:hypothetical protein